MQKVEPASGNATASSLQALGWLAPHWPVSGSVRAVCTTRAGGISAGRYESLNLGDHVGDDPVAVAINRQRVQAAIGARPVFMQQVHGLHVQTLDESSAEGMQADACITAERNVACTIMVADCLPVLFAAADGSHVAAAHAGWRGLAAGVLERTVAMFGSAEPSGIGSSGVQTLAWLGPCIGPNAFEVGDEVKAAFVVAMPASAQCFRPSGSPGKWLANLPALARQRLASCGVTRVFGNDGTDAWCTVHNPSRFFSHRRDGVSGRLAACIWRV